MSNSAKKIQKRINDLTHQYKQQIQLNLSSKHHSLITDRNHANHYTNIRNYTTIRVNTDAKATKDNERKQFTQWKENKKEHDKRLTTIAMYSNYKPKRRYFVSGLNEIKGSFFESPYKKKGYHYPQATDSMFEAIK